MHFLGDSYDIVKQSLLRWLQPFGQWSVHPLFTESVVQKDVKAFELLIGAKVVSTEVLAQDTDRSAYLSCAASCFHLFLDPDTGLLMRPTTSRSAVHYLFASELQWLTERRPDALTIVFDQSIVRGQERGCLETKLRRLRDQGVLAFAYISHACFLIAGRERLLVEQARRGILTESRLPPDRILAIP